MARGKRYADATFYERKLAKVMERFGVDDYNFNWSRFDCFVEFRYRGELYRFDHSVEKARDVGEDLAYGSDAFAQVVLALEDLARMVNRGIYDLSVWVAGMKFLPPVVEVPSFLRFLGFDELPTDAAQIRSRYRTMAKQLHPDNGGNSEDFEALRRCAEQAMQWIEGRK